MKNQNLWSNIKLERVLFKKKRNSLLFFSLLVEFNNENVCEIYAKHSSWSPISVKIFIKCGICLPEYSSQRILTQLENFALNSNVVRSLSRN